MIALFTTAELSNLRLQSPQILFLSYFNKCPSQSKMLKGNCHSGAHLIQVFMSSYREDIGLPRLILEYIFVPSTNKRTLFFIKDGRSLMKMARTQN